MEPADRHTSTDQRGALNSITNDLAYLRTIFVNVLFYGTPGAGDREWVLIDTGLQGYAGRIKEAAKQRFGEHSRPAAIVLTHGHFDHVGTMRDLAEEWGTPIYAHEMEMPYITGRSAYPPPDPTVGGGAVALLSPLFPRGPFDAGSWARALPSDGSIHAMPGWRWIHTPGHSPGHVALFRDADRTLISGDAVVTTKQESALWALTQRPRVHRPPAYYTIDWQAAGESVRALADLEPETLASGHGKPLQGRVMRAALHELARDFERRAVPKRGRYVKQPVIATREGVVSVPPPVFDPLRTGVLAFSGALLAGILLARARRR